MKLTDDHIHKMRRDQTTAEPSSDMMGFGRGFGSRSRSNEKAQITDGGGGEGDTLLLLP